MAAVTHCTAAPWAVAARHSLSGAQEQSSGGHAHASPTLGHLLHSVQMLHAACPGLPKKRLLHLAQQATAMRQLKSLVS